MVINSLVYSWWVVLESDFPTKSHVFLPEHFTFVQKRIGWEEDQDSATWPTRRRKNFYTICEISDQHLILLMLFFAYRWNWKECLGSALSSRFGTENFLLCVGWRVWKLQILLENLKNPFSQNFWRAWTENATQVPLRPC